MSNDDVNQLVIPNKNGDKKSLLFYIIEKGFMESFALLCKTTQFDFAADQGLRNDNGLIQTSYNWPLYIQMSRFYQYFEWRIHIRRRSSHCSVD